jgi:hypothetical protein
MAVPIFSKEAIRQDFEKFILARSMIGASLSDVASGSVAKSCPV